MKRTVIGLAAVATLTLAACGGGGGNADSVGESRTTEEVISAWMAADCPSTEAVSSAAGMTFAEAGDVGAPSTEDIVMCIYGDLLGAAGGALTEPLAVVVGGSGAQSPFGSFGSKDEAESDPSATVTDAPEFGEGAFTAATASVPGVPGAACVLVSEAQGEGGNVDQFSVTVMDEAGADTADLCEAAKAIARLN